MPLEERQKLIRDLVQLRNERACVVVFNFDRDGLPVIPGLSTKFDSTFKEPLFRVLKESKTDAGVDLFIYTRGGDVNAVWPIVSLLREFDPKFQVLVPYACHSAGTMLCLGASNIVLGSLSELSPIDPTCGNAFNPIDPVTKRERLGISVEDVNAYREFIIKQCGVADEQATSVIGPFLQQLTAQVHPLALGNVHRVFQQGRQLARQLLELNDETDLQIDKAVDELSSKFFSHLHMVNRHEAKRILHPRIQFASPELTEAMDNLLRQYETDFRLRKKFVISSILGSDQEKAVRIIGGVVESQNWSYLYETKQTVRRKVDIPQNIQIHLKPGDNVNSIVGLPVNIQFELEAQGWVRNTEPLGITV